MTFSKETRVKLMEKGYILLRSSDEYRVKEGKKIPIIKMSRTDGNWEIHSKYRTKKERDAELGKMIIDKKSPYLYDSLYGEGGEGEEKN